MSSSGIRFFPRDCEPNETSPVQSLFDGGVESYVVLPRLVLQSMPVGWQKAFVDLMGEVMEKFTFPDEGYKYRVRMYGKGSMVATDPLWDHGQGSKQMKAISGGIPDGTAPCRKCNRVHPPGGACVLQCFDCNKKLGLVETHEAVVGKKRIFPLCETCFQKREAE